MYDLIVENAKLYPMSGDASVSAARAFAVRAGRIAALAESREALDGDAELVFDAANRVVLPGFVDCHTHAVYAGNRCSEHRMRLAGSSYEEIARAGGGIVNTVQAVREASEDQLLKESRARLLALMREGVTTIEIKSGYGLDLENEVKLLQVIRKLGETLPADISATFLGLHSVPAGRNKGDYVDDVILNMLPQIAAEKLAGAVDIYVEGIAFDNDDLRRLADAAKALGLSLRAHTDQLSNLGATALAADLGALSCDHLEFINDNDVKAMAATGTVAVLLPGAFYFLGEVKKPPVEKLRAAGVPMAVASDLNPGTSPIASLLACLHFSTTLFGLSSDEALLGITLNAARALGRDADLGSLEKGKMANFCIWDIPSPDYLCYQLGGLVPDARFFNGLQQ